MAIPVPSSLRRENPNQVFSIRLQYREGERETEIFQDGDATETGNEKSRMFTPRDLVAAVEEDKWDCRTRPRKAFATAFTRSSKSLRFFNLFSGTGLNGFKIDRWIFFLMVDAADIVTE